MPVNHTGMLDDVGLGDILLQVFLQEPLHHHRVRPVAAEKCRRLKRPRARMQREMFRVDRNPCQQRGRLQRA
ncbi:hypothetical protein D3C76_1845670 [compost metagenome]